MAVVCAESSWLRFLDIRRQQVLDGYFLLAGVPSVLITSGKRSRLLTEPAETPV
jgi:hypothetical protein